MKKKKKELDKKAFYRKWRIIGALEKIGIFVLIVAIMAGGAAAIYMIKHNEDIKDAEFDRFFESVMNAWGESDENDNNRPSQTTVQKTTTAQQTTTQYVMVNAGGDIDNSDLTDQEKGYQEYIKEQESTTVKEKDTTAAPTEPATTKKEAITTEAPTTTAKPTEAPTTTQPETTTKERETTPAPTTTIRELETTPAPTTLAPTTTVKEQETTPAPTTTAKKQGKVVTDEKMRTALIQMGYDPDNYVASDLSFAQKSELLKLMYGEVATENPNRVIHESVDYSTGTLEYDGPQPKPMG